MITSTSLPNRNNKERCHDIPIGPRCIAFVLTPQTPLGDMGNFKHVLQPWSVVGQVIMHGTQGSGSPEIRSIAQSKGQPRGIISAVYLCHPFGLPFHRGTSSSTTHQIPEKPRAWYVHYVGYVPSYLPHNSCKLPQQRAGHVGDIRALRIAHRRPMGCTWHPQQRH